MKNWTIFLSLTVIYSAASALPPGTVSFRYQAPQSTEAQKRLLKTLQTAEVTLELESLSPYLGCAGGGARPGQKKTIALKYNLRGIESGARMIDISAIIKKLESDTVSAKCKYAFSNLTMLFNPKTPGAWTTMDLRPVSDAPYAKVLKVNAGEQLVKCGMIADKYYSCSVYGSYSLENPLRLNFTE